MIAPVSDPGLIPESLRPRKEVGPSAGRNGLVGIVALTRWKEHILFVTVTTLLGVRFAGESVDSRLPLVWAANCLAVTFAFMFNDVEDAPDDALNPAKKARNPVAAGTLSSTYGYATSFLTALVAAVLYSFLHPTALWLGIASLVLGVLYSWRPVRLKAIPALDILSHSMLLAGMQLLCAYFAFAPVGDLRQWLPPFVFVTAISAYGQLFNEVRDLDFDRKAGLRHTAVVWGPRVAEVLMACALFAAGVPVLYETLSGLIPWWVLLVAVILGVALLRQAMLRVRGHGPLTGSNLHNPSLAIGILAIAVWMAVDHVAR